MAQSEEKDKFAYVVPETKKAIPCRGVQANTNMWIRQMSKRDCQLWGMDKPLWVIDNKIYNLQQFANRHPGGKSWIQLTRGHDITALFKTHHLEQEKTMKIAQKYYVGEAKIKHQSRFNFDGNYKQIRKRILQKFTIAQLQDSKHTQRVCYTITVFIAFLMALTGYLQSYTIAILCGSLMMNFYGIGHLFIHRKDGNPLRHAFLLIGFSAKQQQIMHAISHHPYSNTLLDYQYAGLQPIMNFARCLPKNKWYSLIAVQILFILVGPINVLTKLFVVPIIKKQRISFEHIVFLLQIAYINMFCGNLWMSFKLWCVIVIVYGLFFGKMVLCPHRQIQLWSQGAPQIRDFVMHMIATTTDTNHQKISPYLSLILYSGFNIHVLHHLFPTIDHSKLYQCNKIFINYCKQVGIKVMTSKSMFQCNKNMYCLQVGRKQFDINMFLKE